MLGMLGALGTLSAPAPPVEVMPWATMKSVTTVSSPLAAKPAMAFFTVISLNSTCGAAQYHSAFRSTHRSYCAEVQVSVG